MPALVYKTHNNDNAVVDAGNDGFTELQLDVIAKVITDLRREWQADIEAAITAAVAKLHDEADLTEAVAELRGQVSALMSLIGNSDPGNGSNGRSRSHKTKSVQACEQVIRKLTVTDHSG